MTEHDEIALAMMGEYSTQLTEARTVSSMEAARALVDKKMDAEESATVRGSVAECLHILRRADEKRLRDAYTDALQLSEYWEKRGVILTISRHSLEPLAMRNTIPFVDTRLKRD